MILARLLSAQPTTDMEHWKLKFQLHKDIWHTDAYGQNPAPFYRQPGLSVRQGPPYPWRPAYNSWGSGDAMYPGQTTFGMGLDVSSYPAQLSIYGTPPVNVAQAGNAPQVPLQASTNNTGGTIPPGSYLVAVSSKGQYGPISNFATCLVPPGTNTNTITISGIVWPNVALPSTAGYIGTNVLNMAFAGLTALGGPTGSSPDANGNPTVMTFTSLATGFGLPDANFQKFVIQETPIVHGGVWQDVVVSVSGNVLTFSSGVTWTANQWQNYKLSLYYRPGAVTQAPLNLLVSSSTANTLTMSASGFIAGDVVVMRAAAAHVSANTIGDDNFVNYYAAGLTNNAEVGNLVQIIAGTGAWSAPKTIASNTGTVLTINGTWDVIPDATSVWIVLAPTITYSYSTNPVIQDGVAGIFGKVAVTPAITASSQSLLIQAATADGDGNFWPMRYQPGREIYVPPQNIGGMTGYYTITPVSGTATFKMSNGANQRLVLSGTAVTIAPPVPAAGAAFAAGDSIALYLDQDATGGRAIPTFTPGAGGFASNTAANIVMDGTLNTRTSLVFTFHGSVWGLDSQSTGNAIS